MKLLAPLKKFILFWWHSCAKRHPPSTGDRLRRVRGRSGRWGKKTRKSLSKRDKEKGWIVRENQDDFSILSVLLPSSAISSETPPPCGSNVISRLFLPYSFLSNQSPSSSWWWLPLRRRASSNVFARANSHRYPSSYDIRLLRFDCQISPSFAATRKMLLCRDRKCARLDDLQVVALTFPP